MKNLLKQILIDGGEIKPLIIPSNLTGGTGLMNPSVYNDDGKLLVVVRHVNYTFYHSEAKVFQHPWGPLTYLHPENDMHLRTTNYFCEIDENLNIAKFHKIDMSKFDTYEPKWDFVGLEDARLFRWDGKLYISGVRRDTTPNGQGRMELSEIVVDKDSVKEVSRLRIPAPNNPNSYCEKNWMPVLDLPYYYVKWCKPTEVVKVDAEAGGCKTVVLKSEIAMLPRDVRGGSQVMKIGEYYFALTHEVDLFNSEVGRKDAVYHHRFIVWDKDWNIIKASREFFFMDAQVEFSVGMCRLDNKNLVITFGFQDNAAYIMRVPLKTVENFMDFKFNSNAK